MHPYLTHLLTDIKATHREEDHEPEYAQKGLEIHFKEIDRWFLEMRSIH
ncbi:hypothetical protein [Echinicola sp. 20G]|nr:hypothetical protein [Echinicola sp. 20G]